MNLTELADAIEAASGLATNGPWEATDGGSLQGLTRDPDQHWNGRSHLLGRLFKPDDADIAALLRSHAPAIVAALRWGERAKVVLRQTARMYDDLSLGTLEAAAKYGPDYEPLTDDEILAARSAIDALLAAYPDAKPKEPTDEVQPL